MKLPAKVIYACKAITELAIHHGSKTPVRVQTIAEAQGIPKKFLVQLLLRLKSNGIVSSTRGILGGYLLSKDPASITIADVVRAIDDSIITIALPEKSNNPADIIFRSIWKETNTDIVSKLSGVTFEEIVTKLQTEELTYYI